METLDAIPAETPVVAIVNLAGASILGGRWTARRKAILLESRIDVTSRIRILAERLGARPSVLVNASAVGFYGARPDGGEVDETAPPQPGQFQSDLCAAWEAQAKSMQAMGIRVVRMRFGGVLGRDGGLYPPLAFAARFGLGAILGTGRQSMPWVHLHDAVAALRCAIDQPTLEGAVNVVAPERMSQAEFARSIAQATGRAIRLHVPGAIIAGLAGEAATILLDGQAATPRRLLAAGFRFKHATLRSAVADLNTRPSQSAKRPAEQRQPLASVRSGAGVGVIR